jgi:hypothetical protein
MEGAWEARQQPLMNSGVKVDVASACLSCSVLRAFPRGIVRTLELPCKGLPLWETEAVP